MTDEERLIARIEKLESLLVDISSDLKHLKQLHNTPTPSIAPGCVVCGRHGLTSVVCTYSHCPNNVTVNPWFNVTSSGSNE